MGRTTKTYAWRYAHPLKEDAFAVETMHADNPTTPSSVIDPKSEVETEFFHDCFDALALGRRLMDAAESAS